MALEQPKMDLQSQDSRSRAASNWKPWQTSPYLLIPLLAVGVVIIGILEHLAQLSQPTLSEEAMLEMWFDWYRLSRGVYLEELEVLSPKFEDYLQLHLFQV